MVAVAALDAGNSSYASRRGAPYHIYTHGKHSLTCFKGCSPLARYLQSYEGRLLRQQVLRGGRRCPRGCLCVSCPLHGYCQVLTLCSVVVGLWKPHDPQASLPEAQFSQHSTHLTPYIPGMQDAIHNLSL